MNRFQFIGCCALVALSCCRPCSGQVAVVTFSAYTPEEALVKGGTYIGREAFQLQGGNGLSSILYSDPFPITVWGESRPVPGTWEHRSGLMQEIPQRDFPADWFDIEPRGDGTMTLRQWHILEGDYGSASNNAHFYPWYITGLDWLKGLRIQRDSFFIYRWANGTPAQYQIYYGSSAGNVPEPATLALLLLPLGVAAMRRRGR